MKCYKCEFNTRKTTVVKDGISLNCYKCDKCGEEYFSSSELIKHDVLTGKNKLVRKFGVLGDSMITRIPKDVVKEYEIKKGDIAIFEKRPDGFLIRCLKV